MNMNNQAIKVDLSSFFDDERKLAFIFVDPNWKTVECLQRRVEDLFDISSVWFLSNGCFLPSKESIDILKYCDVIKAFVLKGSQELRKAKKSKKSKDTLEKPNNVEAVLEGNNAKDDNSNFTEESNNLERSFNSNPIKPSKKRKCDRDHGSLTDAYDIRTKTNLSKITSSTLINESNLLEEDKNPQKLSTPKNPKNPFKKCKTDKAHIYFDETGNLLSPITQKEKKTSLPKMDTKSGTVVVFRCPLNDVTNGDGAQPQKPRIFHLKSKNRNASQLIEIQEDILLPIHATINATNNKSCSINQATMINNVEKDGTENEPLNCIISQTENVKQVSSENLNKDSQNEEINSNETENESMANKDVAESSHINETEFSCVDDEPVSETQNEKQKKIISKSIDGNVSSFQNKSQIDCMSADKSHAVSQIEPAYFEDQASEELKDTAEATQISENENSVMSVDCVDLSVDLEYEAPVEDDIREQHKPTAHEKCNESSDSDVEEVSEVIDLNESNNNCSATSNNSKQNISSEGITVDKILPFSRDMTDLPSADDIIIFKVPCAKIKKRVGTNFIAGKVEYVNKRTKNIKVLILDGISELCHVPKNFICNLDDSNDDSKHLQLKFTDMIEPKLFSM